MNIPIDSTNENLWALKVQYDCLQHKTKTIYGFQPINSNSLPSFGQPEQHGGDKSAQEMDH